MTIHWFKANKNWVILVEWNIWSSSTKQYIRLIPFDQHIFRTDPYPRQNWGIRVLFARQLISVSSRETSRNPSETRNKKRSGHRKRESTRGAKQTQTMSPNRGAHQSPRRLAQNSAWLWLTAILFQSVKRGIYGYLCNCWYSSINPTIGVVNQCAKSWKGGQGLSKGAPLAPGVHQVLAGSQPVAPFPRGTPIDLRPMQALWKNLIGGEGGQPAAFFYPTVVLAVGLLNPPPRLSR